MWYTLKWRPQQYQKPEKVAGSIANILRVGEAEDSIERTCMELGTYGACHKMENQQWIQDWTMNVQN